MGRNVDMAPEFELVFPLSGAHGTSVSVSINELKTQNHAQFVKFLQQEVVPLKHWRELALAYHRLGMIGEFIETLKEGTTIHEEDFMEVYCDQVNDIITMLVMLGTYYDQQAGLSDKQRQQDYIRLAEQEYAKADKLVDRSKPHHTIFVGRGNHHMMLYKLHLTDISGTKAKEHLQKASTFFKRALEQSDRSAAALNGAARAHFCSEEFQDALKVYRELFNILQERTVEGLSSVRLGIAQCYFKLGRRDAAIEALEVALKHCQPHEDEIQVEILCALADVQASCANGVSDSLPLLEKALEIRPNSTVAFSQLANHLFHAGDLTDIPVFLEGVLLGSTDLRIRGDARYQQGRLAHLAGNLQEAHRKYMECLKLCPNHATALYAAAQTSYALGKPLEALTLIERVRRMHPRNYDVLKLSAELLSRQPSRSHAALEVITELLLIKPNDVDVLFISGVLQQTKNPKKALEHFKKYLDLTGNATPELCNNMGALYQINNEWEEAERMYNMTADLLVDRTDAESQTLKYILRYNVIRWHQLKLDPDMDYVEAELKRLVHDAPHVDTKIALGLLYSSRGRFEDALAIFEELVLVGQQDATFLKAATLHKKDDLSGALDVLVNYDRKLRSEGQLNVFTSVQLGYLFHEKAMVASRLRRMAKSDERKQDVVRHSEQEKKYLDQALMCFMRALEVDKSIWHAVRGVAVVMAHKGHCVFAQSMLNKLKKHTHEKSQLIPLHVDLGHLCMELSHNKEGALISKQALHQAIGFYRLAYRQAPMDSNVCLYYASSLYHGAVALEDPGLFRDCQAILNKAVLLDPTDIRLRFNTATVLMRVVFSALRDTARMQMEDHVEDAIFLLGTAVRHFEYLQRMKVEGSALNLQYVPKQMAEPTRLSDNAEYCRKALVQCHTFLQRLKEQRREREAEKAEKMRLQAELDAAAILRKQEEEEEQQIANADLEAAAESLMAEAKEYNLVSKIEETPAGHRKESKNPAAPNDDFIDNTEYPMQPPVNVTLEDLGLADSDDEDDFTEKAAQEEAVSDNDSMAADDFLDGIDVAQKRQREDSMEQDEEFFSDLAQPVDDLVELEGTRKKARVDSDEEDKIEVDEDALNAELDAIDVSEIGALALDFEDVDDLEAELAPDGDDLFANL